MQWSQIIKKISSNIKTFMTVPNRPIETDLLHSPFWFIQEGSNECFNFSVEKTPTHEMYKISASVEHFVKSPDELGSRLLMTTPTSAEGLWEQGQLFQKIILDKSGKQSEVAPSALAVTSKTFSLIRDQATNCVFLGEKLFVYFSWF